MHWFSARAVRIAYLALVCRANLSSGAHALIYCCDTRLSHIHAHTFTCSVHPEWSGKMETLQRLMAGMRRSGDDRIVVVSNYTSALDLIGNLCRENDWPYCRLDGRYRALSETDAQAVYSSHVCALSRFSVICRFLRVCLTVIPSFTCVCSQTRFSTVGLTVTVLHGVYMSVFCNDL